MYVCVCHAINEAGVEKAIQEGAETPEQVLEHYGNEFRCRLCEPYIQEHLDKRAHSSAG